MKTRMGLVSNSSATSFYITNLSDQTLTIVDFVKENPQLIEEYISRYGCPNQEEFCQYGLIRSAQFRLNMDPKSYTIPPKKRKYMIFGDNNKDTIGCVFDYILRDGGKSQNFSWKEEASLR